MKRTTKEGKHGHAQYRSRIRLLLPTHPVGRKNNLLLVPGMRPLDVAVAERIGSGLQSHCREVMLRVSHLFQS